MLIEIKVKVQRTVDNKIRKFNETYLIDKEFFAEAEYAVTQHLTEEQHSHLLETFAIQSQKLSSIKELATQYEGNNSYIATLKDVWLETDGTEKYLRYKVLLWADNVQEATERVLELSREGYDMSIEGLKEVNYIYLETSEENDSNE